MAEASAHREARQTRSLRFARFVVRNRGPVLLLLIAATAYFFYPILNTAMTAFGNPLPGPLVRIDTRPRDLFPDHPYIRAQDEFGKFFGGSSAIAIAVTVKEGTIFTVDRLRLIHEATRRLDGQGFESHSDEREKLRAQLEREGILAVPEIRDALDRAYPRYPVNHDQISSIAHGSTRLVQIEADGSITTDILMREPPETQQAADNLRELVRQNSASIFGRLVSRDEQGALITAGFVTDRLSNVEVYEAVFDHVQQIKADLEDESIRIHVSGAPILRGWIFKYAFEILAYLVAAVAVIFGLLWFYFRRWQGVLVPAIAALTTVIWGLGFTGWMGIRFDPLILVIPMIITARAVSHAVQMMERFFEDYEVYLPRFGDPDRAKVEAATAAMGELIVPGTLGIVTDVAGLLVILLTTIPQMRELGIFGAFWVVSIVATVEVLHPVTICYLPAPKRHEHFSPRFMVRFTDFIGMITTHPKWKYAIAGSAVTLLIGSTSLALFHSRVGEAKPGTSLLWPDHEWNQAAAEIATRFGGIDTLTVYLDGDRPHASTDAAAIQAMERFERHMKQTTELGGSVSLAPLLRTYWRIYHQGDPKWSFVPDDTGTVRSIIFQLRQSGAPGFLRPFTTDDGRKAAISFFYPDHKSDTIERARHFGEQFIEENPLGEISIRLRLDEAALGAGYFDTEKLKDMAYYMIGPLLPPRHHTLGVRIRQEDESYDSAAVNAASNGLPGWIDEFRHAAIEDFSWPDRLAAWSNEDVDYWWEDRALGVRSVAVNTRDLIVADMKAVDSAPKYQPTNSWTRGVQFVMAGGSMGILAAINEEVERSHVANIALIFAVIFVLHAVTYRSIPSGGIILLQISTATMMSLAYMSIRNIGLNINTLPVQSVGVGIGVDYAIYIVDRIRQEVAVTADIDEAIRRAVRTTGMAVSFTATTIIGGIFLWMFSDLRFQAEMAQLLVILMVINMLGAIIIVPVLYSILRPKVATALLSAEQLEAIRTQKERDKNRGSLDRDP